MDLFMAFIAGGAVGMLVLGALQILLDTRKKAKIIDLQKWKEEHKKK